MFFVCICLLKPSLTIVIEELTRDHQPAVEDPYLRLFRLLPWQQCDVDEEITKHAKEMEGKEMPKVRVSS